LRTTDDKINDPKTLTHHIPKTHGWGNITRMMYVYPDDLQNKFSLDDVLFLINQAYQTIL